MFLFCIFILIYSFGYHNSGHHYMELYAIYVIKISPFSPLASKRELKKLKRIPFFFFDTGLQVSSYHTFLAEHTSLATSHPYFFQLLEGYASLLK